MKICHVSDWHASLTSLPGADIYVVTGDMLPNFPIVKIFNPKTHGEGIWDETGPWPEGYHYGGREIDPEREARLQLEWMKKNPFRESTGINWIAPIVVVRGNHDFVELGPWMGGLNVFEISEDPTRTVEFEGVKFGGVRGINWIVGEWADELHEAEFDTRARGLPDDLDILVTHSPPLGMRDVGKFGDHIGSPALGSYVNKRMQEFNVGLRAHLFGHLHGPSFGQEEQGGCVFSNAAEGVQMVELDI